MSIDEREFYNPIDLSQEQVPILDGFTRGECFNFLQTHERSDSNKSYVDYIKEQFSKPVHAPEIMPYGEIFVDWDNCESYSSDFEKEFFANDKSE